MRKNKKKTKNIDIRYEISEGIFLIIKEKLSFVEQNQYKIFNKNDVKLSCRRIPN